VTPVEGLISRLRAAGFAVRLDGEGVRIRPHPGEGTLAEIRAMKPELVAHFRAIQAAKSTEARNSARHLRAGTWQREPAPCAFFIGNASENACRRCGGSWSEHFNSGRKSTETLDNIR
jgi:hypothetical protein